MYVCVRVFVYVGDQREENSSSMVLWKQHSYEWPMQLDPIYKVVPIIIVMTTFEPSFLNGYNKGLRWR